MPDPPVTVRPLTSPEEMRQGVVLYRDVFELTPTDPAVSPRLLAALRHNGGSVVGAFADAELVGFAYGFLGMDGERGHVFHYSQMAAVHAGWQGLGVGRALKLGQRDHVLGTGVTHMRWAYDPLRTRNAHFNLDVLGARARWFVPDMFGVEETGRDVGMPSDRVIVEWDLAGVPDDAPWPAGDLTDLPWGDPAECGREVLLALPGRWSELLRREPERAGRVRGLVTASLSDLLSRGYEAVSCQRLTPDTTVGTPADIPVDIPVDTAVYRLRR